MSPPAILRRSPPLSEATSRVRVSALIPPSLHPWILLLVLTAIPAASAASAAQISYADHCSSTVPESVTGQLPSSSPNDFLLSNGHFSGGDELLGRRDSDPTFSLPRSFFFHPKSLRRTQTPGVHHLAGTLTLRGGGIRLSRRNLTERRSLLVRVRPRFPRTFNPRGKASFDLSGFWSESTGLLCMVGSGHGRSKEGTLLDLSAVFKLNYPNMSTISSSLASGTVDIFDATGTSNHFDPISVLVYAQKNYEYTQISKVEELCSRVNAHELSLGFKNSSFCSDMLTFTRGRFRLDYSSNCSNGHCGPLASSLGYSPSFVSLNQIHCSEDGKLHMYIAFSNLSSFAHNSLLVPDKALVGEGVWDQTRNRLCILACRIRNNTHPLLHASIDDCTIGFSLWFPAVLTIENRSTAVGRIWSNLNENDLAYFDMVSLRNFWSNMDTVPGLRYEYTKMNVVRKSCVQDNGRKVAKKRYPDGKSYADMRFDISIKNTQGKIGWGYASPLSIGEKFYGYSYMVTSTPQEPEHESAEMNHNLWNISYTVTYTFPNASLDSNEPTEISAEGIYNTQTGLLCMVGCQYRVPSVVTESVRNGDAMDCEIIINMQFSSVNSKSGEHLTGTITSSRKNSDPLFFETLEISSYGMYTKQAAESIWRMDVEITLVLMSLTLSCIFIGLQLFHIKKHPDVLPSMSITMLVILTLGHMIPLVLNFEAMFFRNHNRQNVLLWSGGWLEVNEVIVRVITMIAFLLQFRLLQLAWSVRSANESKRGLWAAERKALVLCLPLYFAVGLIALFAHLRSHEIRLVRLDSTHRHSLWDDTISFAGLILDGFLLPQVVLNFFLNSKDRSLAPSFYVGTTVVRALPHIYDAYRARLYVPHFKSSYIYASPDGDLYSSAWDVIIPCEGVLFALLIFLQQRFGGACFLPLKNKQLGEYEMVPVVSS